MNKHDEIIAEIRQLRTLDEWKYRYIYRLPRSLWLALFVWIVMTGLMWRYGR